MQYKPWEIKDERILVFSDFHQNEAWVKAVLEFESGNFDHIVFLGDAFDSFDEPPQVSSAEQSAIFLKQLLDEKHGKFTYLIGNHDLSYMEASYQVNKGYTVKSLFNACGGYTNSKAKKINHAFSREDWSKAQIFCVANGHLLSHAGFRENNWRPFRNDEENLDKLWEEGQEALELLPFKPSHFFTIGYGRGGHSEYGGPLWLDWDTEFEDNLPLPQIVGHSFCRSTIRQIGHSYCIDGGQTTYCVIHPDGKIDFKSMEYSPYEQKFLAQTPCFRNDDSHVAARQNSVNPNLISRAPISGFTY